MVTSNEKHIYFEIQSIGAYRKVTAVDPDTLVEVTVSGPVDGSVEEIKAVALKKLEYVLRKKQNNSVT